MLDTQLEDLLHGARTEKQKSDTLSDRGWRSIGEIVAALTMRASVDAPVLQPRQLRQRYSLGAAARRAHPDDLD
jgi:hypothetical protein